VRYADHGDGHCEYKVETRKVDPSLLNEEKCAITRASMQIAGSERW
jgi:hypothetical protein